MSCAGLCDSRLRAGAAGEPIARPGYPAQPRGETRLDDCAN